MHQRHILPMGSWQMKGYNSATHNRASIHFGEKYRQQKGRAGLHLSYEVSVAAFTPQQGYGKPYFLYFSFFLLLSMHFATTNLAEKFMKFLRPRG